MTDPLKPLIYINFKDKSFHNSKEWSGLYLQVIKYPTMVGKNFQIYGVQITGKCIL